MLDDLGLLTRHKLRPERATGPQTRSRPSPGPGDATQLEQAFLNLTLNALEAMPNGGTLTIGTRQRRTTMEAPVTEVAVEFKDTGTGMTPEQQKRAFSSLLQSTKQKGTGLGLAIVGRIVEAHRGKLQVRSRVGSGTTFTVALPCYS